MGREGGERGEGASIGTRCAPAACYTLRKRNRKDMAFTFAGSVQDGAEGPQRHPWDPERFHGLKH